MKSIKKGVKALSFYRTHVFQNIILLLALKNLLFFILIIVGLSRVGVI